MKGALMARWLIEYYPYVKFDPTLPGSESEVPSFRIYPEDAPDKWIAQTNEDLPREMQEEAALLIAEALSQVLGI
jgi:hypothetical protein